MKRFIRKIDEQAELYVDRITGIALVKDLSTGRLISCHSDIDASGSVVGIKARGAWRKRDRTVRSFGLIFNIDTFFCDDKEAYQVIAAMEC